MSTFSRKIDDLSLDDLQNLITYKVREGSNIEYKSQMIREEQICTAVSSFANTYGGDFYIGIEESNGEPTSLVGIEVKDIDHEELRINNILQNGVEPRLGRYDLKSFQVASGKYVILIRVYRSWTRPHRVIKNQKFYSRKSNGKFPMDVHELREMFLGTTEFFKKYERFKEERLLFCANAYGDRAFFMAHLLPLSCFENQYSLDMGLLNRINLKPIASADWNPRVNFHGLYSESERAESRTQIFRSGIIELTTVRLTSESKINSEYFESRLISCIIDQIKNYKIMGIDEPFYLTCSFYGVEGFNFVIRFERFDDVFPLSEDKLVLPEILVDPSILEPLTPVAVGQTIKPILDALWNAFGIAKAELAAERTR